MRRKWDVGIMFPMRDGNELGDSIHSVHFERGDGTLQLETVCSCSEGPSKHRHCAVGKAQDHLD